MGEGNGYKIKFLGVSILVFSLLSNPINCETNSVDSSQVDVEGDVTLQLRNKQVGRRIEYSRGGHIAYYYGTDDNSFEADDFRKGIHIAKNTDDNVCYLIPVGNMHAREKHMDEFIKKWHGKVFDFDEDSSQFKTHVVDGKLSDTSFLSQSVHDECTNGYQWMILTPRGVNSGVLRGKLRQKRGCEYGCSYSSRGGWQCGVTCTW